MPNVAHGPLRDYVAKIFAGAGASEADARVVSDHLVDANLLGHDSHGVIRVARYVRNIESGTTEPRATPRVERSDGATAVVDGGWTFGQVVAHFTMDEALARARAHGVGLAVAHRCGHVGRVGAYVEQAVRAGMLGIAMVNNHGGGRVLAAPGGRERRLSPNPIAIAVPTPDPDAPFVLDMTSSVVAVGKVDVARNRGDAIPEGWVIDHAGHPATDPAALAGPPPGALLPLGGAAAHKGFGLALVVEALAGALSPAGTSREGAPSAGNGLFTLAIDIARFRDPEDYATTIGELLAWVQSPPYLDGVERILVPGDPERAARAERETAGIAIEDATWQELTETGTRLGVEALAL